MALENVPYRLVTDGIAHVFQRPDDAVVPPGAVLLGQPYHWRLQLRIDSGAPWRLALSRAIEFLHYELPVPGYDGLRFNDAGHLLKGLFTQPPANLGQGLAFPVAQSYTPLNLLTQDAVFHHQILVTQEELLVHRTRDRRQELLPIHASFHLRRRLSH
jgi:hypothetical protein